MVFWYEFGCAGAEWDCVTNVLNLQRFRRKERGGEAHERKTHCTTATFYGGF